MSKIQAILFDRNYWNLKEISSFLVKHNLYPIKKVHLTKQYYRVRLRKPNKQKEYRTKKIEEGLKFIIEVP